MIVFSNIAATGANITTGAASVAVAIPVASSGEIPRYIRIVATQNSRIRLGNGAGTTAIATDTMIVANYSLYLMVPRGMTHIAALQDTVAGTVAISPLEDC